MMATVSSHILNAVDGSHAGGIVVRLVNLATGETLFEAKTDAGGRLKEEISNIDTSAEYELTFDVGHFWDAHGKPTRIRAIALRFDMPDPGGSYHSPIIVSPNGYSGWVSS